MKGESMIESYAGWFRLSQLHRTLPLLCFTLFGCGTVCNGYLEKVTTQEDAQHAAFVLITRNADNIKNLPQRPVHRVVRDAGGNESVVMDFNWHKITIAGVPLSTFPERYKAREFTLNVFDYDSGRQIPSASISSFEPIDAQDRELTGIPLNTLLRTDILFKLKGQNEEDAYGPPVSFILLFKKGTDLER
jgi:hypothetical protein